MDTHEFNPARGHEGEYKHESNCVVPFGGGSTDRDPAAKGHFHKALRILALALAPLCGHAYRVEPPSYAWAEPYSAT